MLVVSFSLLGNLLPLCKPFKIRHFAFIPLQVEGGEKFQTDQAEASRPK